MLQDFTHNLLAVDPIRFGLKGHEHAVPEHIVSDALDVLGGDKTTVLHKRVGTRGFCQSKRRARACADLDLLFELRRSLFLREPSRKHDG